MVCGAVVCVGSLFHLHEVEGWSNCRVRVDVVDGQ